MFAKYIFLCTFVKQTNQVEMENIGKQTVLVTRDKIKETESFKSLSTIRQEMTLNRVNVNYINNGINILKNIGLEQWKSTTSYSNTNQEIIIEIFNNLQDA